MATELKPCPFCGGPVHLEKTIDEREWWGIVCRNTRNRGGTCAISIRASASEEAAVARWNMRAQAQQDAPTDERKAFEEHMRRNHPHAMLHRRDMEGSERFGEYCRSAVEDCWRVWQARSRYAPAQDAERERDYTRHLETALQDCAKVAILRGDVYLCDCIDNTGNRYQSQFLADLLARAQRAGKGGA